MLILLKLFFFFRFQLGNLYLPLQRTDPSRPDVELIAAKPKSGVPSSAHFLWRGLCIPFSCQISCSAPSTLRSFVCFILSLPAPKAVIGKNILSLGFSAQDKLWHKSLEERLCRGERKEALPRLYSNRAGCSAFPRAA